MGVVGASGARGARGARGAVHVDVHVHSQQ